jgi:hypothetical protein
MYVFCLRGVYQQFIFTCPFARLIWRTIQFTINIPPPANVTSMFENWLNGVEKNLKRIVERVFVLLCGLYGMVVTILYLTKVEMLIFYRLFESTSGPIYSRRRSGRIRILDAFIWRRLHRISTIRMAGGFLEEYMMHRCFILILFCWLIFVYTLMWFVRFVRCSTLKP